MYTFVAVAGVENHESRAHGIEQDLARWGDTLVNSLGAPGEARVQNVVSVPEIQGGWVMIGPAQQTGPALLSHEADEQYTTLVFGRVDGARGPCREVCDAFQKAGVDGVARLGGVFSGLLVERKRRRLHVFCSMLAFRSLRYHQSGSRLTVSPLDLGVAVAAGLRAEPDLSALAVASVCGWGLGGRSLIPAVSECDSLRCLQWQLGGTEERAVDPIMPARRIERADARRVARHVDDIVEQLRSGVDESVRQISSPDVTVSLTAGMDSRACLALVASLVDRKRIEARTVGAPEDQDVRVAKSLCAALGIRHRRVDRPTPNEESFLQAARRLAVATNGAADAEVAISIAARDVTAPQHLGGSGGEIFRGFYYPYVRRPPPARNTADVASALLRSPLARLRRLESACAPSSAGSTQLLATLERSSALSSDAHDLADLFYLFERYCRWGSAGIKLAEGATVTGPFNNSRAIQMAFELPAPIGDAAIIAQVVKKLGPRILMWWPVNGREFVWLQGGGLVRNVSRELLRGSNHLIRRSRRALRGEPSRTSRSLGRLLAFRGLLREKLLQDGSLAQQVFGKDALERALAGEGPLANTPALGVLFSAELWFEQLRAVQRHTPAGTRD